MKRFVKSALQRVGYRIQATRHIPRQLLEDCAIRAIEFDDVVCRRMVEVGRELTFVQVGVFDGETKDPLRRYIQTCGWQGTMVEPQPTAAAKLRAMYAQNGRVEIVEAAVDRQCGGRALFTVDGSKAPAWAGGLASFHRETILKHSALIPGLEQMIREVKIRTTTFDNILERLPSKQLDVLQIDTEGADALLISLFPFDRVRPAIVHWEVKHLTMAEREMTLGRLRGHDYRFAPSGGEDMLAVLF